MNGHNDIRHWMRLVETSDKVSAAKQFVADVIAMHLPAKVSLTYYNDTGDVVIESLTVSEDQRQQRRATETMRAILALADERGIRLGLWPLPPDEDDEPLSSDDLERWYSRMGFKWGSRVPVSDDDDENNRHMWRSPL